MMEQDSNLLISRSTPVGLLSGLLTLVCLASSTGKLIVTTQDTNQLSNKSLPLLNSDNTVTVKPVHNAPLAHTDCTDPHISLHTLTSDDGPALLTVSGAGVADARMTSLPCGVHLTSQPGSVVSAVLLEHSPCDGGVFVLLWDNATHRSWDVCSVWHAPGPDFMATSNVVNVSVELIGVSNYFDFTIHVRAMEKPRGELEMRYLTATEGKCLCLCLSQRVIIIIINLIYIAQFDTNGILTALYIVITYIQMQYVHVCTYAEQSYKYTYTCLHIHTYTVTCTNIHLPTY